MPYLMGIDVGTSSAKALILDTQGNVLACAASSYDIATPQEGYAEQDAQMLWRAVCEATAKSVALAKTAAGDFRISAIGVTGQMHGLVALDRDDKPVRPVIIWADQRSYEQVKVLKEIGISERTGNQAATGFLLPSLMWIKQSEPEVYEQIRHVLLPKDYIRFRICSELGTDLSDASGTALYNINERRWDREVLSSMGIAAELLPEVHRSFEIAGKVNGTFADRTGLERGIPVVYGGGDTPMQLAGNGVVSIGQLSTNIGTASQISCITATPPGSGGRLNCFHHVPDDLWIAVGASLNGGLLLKWIRQFCLNNQVSYADMDTMAEASRPGAGGMVLLPFLCGERSPYMDEKATGILYGMKLSNGRDDFIRAAMESVVYSFKDCMRIFKEIGLPIGDEVIASGGGAKSATWLKLQADILQKTVKVSKGGEEACRGAAMVAGVGTGAFSTFEEASGAILQFESRIYEPEREDLNIYEDRFETYRALYANNRSLFDR